MSATALSNKKKEKIVLAFQFANFLTFVNSEFLIDSYPVSMFFSIFLLLTVTLSEIKSLLKLNGMDNVMNV